MNDRIRGLAQTLWDYHHLNHQLARADAILVLCSHDKTVAKRGAALFLEGWAPLLIFAGGLGAITRHLWQEPEADQFAAIAAGMGVPKERILVENRSTNTGENVQFTRQLLAEKGLDPQSFIVVQKPYMERRSYATFRKVWPEKAARGDVAAGVDGRRICSEYSHDALSPDDVVASWSAICSGSGCYPAKGFQIHQDIPDDVWRAYEELVKAGYDKYLI